jgi:N-methylhydantoinase B
MSASDGRLNENIVHRSDGSLSCAHCGQDLDGGPTDYLSLLPQYESSITEVGPHVFPDPRVFTDVDAVFRQYICPGCATAFHTEVVPVGDAYVSTAVTAPA